MKTEATKKREHHMSLKELEKVVGSFEGVFGPISIPEVTEMLDDLQTSLDDYDMTFTGFMKYVMAKMDVISMNVNEDWGEECTNRQ